MKRAFILTSLLAIAVGFTASTVQAQNAYNQVDLVSDVSGEAARTDANLRNPWGIVPGPTGVFWVANQLTGTSTLYQPDGTPVSLVVDIPGGSPTGIALANDGDLEFEIPSGDTTANAVFIFVSLGGTISAWSPAVDSDDAIEVASNEGAVYTGVTLAATGEGARLYAANFAEGKVDVYDADFEAVTLDAGDFVDPNLPANYAPFNVATIDGQIYVAYALRGGDGRADPGDGQGYISVFETDGDFVRRFASSGELDAPWAMVEAPAGFGEFGGDLLVGNFGDGRILAYDTDDGAFQGALEHENGDPIVKEGLWGLWFGHPASGSEVANRLYFAAGIEAEEHGLFGYIEVAEDGDGDGDGEPSCENHSRGFGFWRKACGGPHAFRDDETRGLGNHLAFGSWKGRERGLGLGNGKNGNGNGNGGPKGVPADSLEALMACISDGDGPFGDGGCFTAGCELLQMKGKRSSEQKVAQHFLVLLANRCAGLICDDQPLSCDDDDGEDDDGEDDDGEDDDADIEDLIDEHDLDTVGDVIDFVNDRLCDNGGEGVSLGQLKALIGCAMASGRDDDDDDDDGDDDDGDDDHRTSGRVAQGRLQVRQLGANPIRIAAGSEARLEVSSQPLSIVRLGIYDAAGRVVARLMRDVAVASPTEVRWDGRNLHGEPVPPGTYFYRATGAGAVTSGRIVVLR